MNTSTFAISASVQNPSIIRNSNVKPTLPMVSLAAWSPIYIATLAFKVWCRVPFSMIGPWLFPLQLLILGLLSWKGFPLGSPHYPKHALTATCAPALALLPPPHIQLEVWTHGWDNSHQSLSSQSSRPMTSLGMNTGGPSTQKKNQVNSCHQLNTHICQHR